MDDRAPAPPLLVEFPADDPDRARAFWEGVLGVVTLVVKGAADVTRLVTLQTAGQINRAPGYEAWTTDAVEVRSAQPVEAGVDGEALTYDPPVRFEIRPAALRVRVARNAPGVSPAHTAARVRHAGLATLLQVAAGRAPT